MARRARVDGPGLSHHVMLRGGAEMTRRLFEDAVDRAHFVARARDVFADTGVRCLAWSLVADEAHLVVTTGPTPLARAMQRLTTGYAADHHRRHRVGGHLYADRYRSLLLGNRRARRLLLRHVHLRPLACGEVADVEALAGHPWSGHASLMGGPADGLVDVRAALRLFAPRRDDARHAVVDFLRTGVGDDRLDSLLKRPNGRPRADEATFDALVARLDDAGDAVAGSHEFVAEVLAEADAARARTFRLVHAGWDVSSLARWVCGEVGADPRDLPAGRRTREVSAARAAIAWLATDALGLPAADLTGPLGVSPSALSRALGRGRTVCEGLPPLPDCPPPSPAPRGLSAASDA
jgi:putative transposase